MHGVDTHTTCVIVQRSKVPSSEAGYRSCDDVYDHRNFDPLIVNIAAYHVYNEIVNI